MKFLIFATQALSFTFGGFSADEGRYLAEKGLVCRPVAVAPGGAVRSTPDCESLEPRAVKEIGFKKPARARKTPDGKLTLRASVEDEKLKIVAIDEKGGERVLVSFAPGNHLVAVNQNLFVAPSGRVIAVEWTELGKGGESTNVAAFDVSAALPTAQQSPPQQQQPPQQPAPSPPQGGKTAYERAIDAGGQWEQSIHPCDQAGVKLKLDKKKKTFTLRIETKCQGTKDTTDLDGTWKTEGASALYLMFENEGGPSESMTCQFETCTDSKEDCLSCTQEDISFTLQSVRR
jgi:hypothetical protein